MRIGILGGGSIVQKAYLPLLSSWPGVEIAGLLSRTEKTVQAAVTQWHIQFGTTSLDALLEKKLDAVFVLTANDAHFEQIQALLEAGIDVYAEKPLVESSAQAEQLARLAEARQRILMVGYNRRYAPLYRQAREIFAGRQIKLCVVEKHRTFASHPSLFKQYIDDTIHQIDLLRFYCGDMQAEYTAYEMKGDRMVNAASACRLANGGIGLVQTNLSAGAWQERLALHGDGLSVEVDAFQRLRVKHQDHMEVYGADRAGRWAPDLVERGFHGEIEHFFKCVASRQTPETDAWESVKTQKLMEDMVEKAAS